MRNAIVLPLSLLIACTSRVDVEPGDDTGSTGEVSSTGDVSADPDPSESSAPGTAATTAEPTTAPDASSSEGGSSEDTGASESTGTGAYSVSGVVTRSVEPIEGNDGVGPLYIAIVSACDRVFDLVATDVVLDADPGQGAAWEIPFVPEGTWYFIAFLDDDGDAELPAPMPDRGDLVASDGLGGIGCAEITVDGADVTGVELDLDFVLPF